MNDAISASAVLILALLGLLVLRRRSASLALGLALGCPLFFQLSSNGLQYGHSVLAVREGVTLPLSIFALPLFAPELVAGFQRLARPVLRLGRVEQLALAFAAWAVVAFAWGTFSGGARPLILVQVLVPLLVFAIGLGIATLADVRGVLVGLVIGCVVTAVLLVISTVVLPANPALSDARLNDAIIGGFVVFQAWDYLPLLFVSSAFIAFGLYRPDGLGPRFLAGGAILVVAVLALYSRGATLTLLVGLVALVVGMRNRASRRLRLLSVTGVAALVIAFAALGGSSTSRILDTLRGAGADAAASDGIRADAVKRGADLVEAQPLFGQGMRPSDVDPSTGVPKTVNAHNQYLDYAVRGGLPLALAFIAMLLVALVRLWRVALRDPEPLWLGLAVTLTAVTLVSNMLQVNFVQPLTAFPLWFVLGLTGSAAFQSVAHPSSDARPLALAARTDVSKAA